MATGMPEAGQVRATAKAIYKKIQEHVCVVDKVEYQERYKTKRGMYHKCFPSLHLVCPSFVCCFCHVYTYCRSSFSLLSLLCLSFVPGSLILFLYLFYAEGTKEKMKLSLGYVARDYKRPGHITDHWR